MLTKSIPTNVKFIAVLVGTVLAPIVLASLFFSGFRAVTPCGAISDRHESSG